MMLTRRHALALGASAAATLALPIQAAKRPDSRIRGVQIGVITYSYRELADQSAAAILSDCVGSGISAIELMGTVAESYAGLPPSREAARSWRASAPMERFESLRQLYARSGVRIYAFKPSVFGADNSEAEIDYGMRAALALGANQVTAELPQDLGLARRLGEAARAHGLLAAYHAHTQASPTAWDDALAASEGNAINLDLGHFVAAGDYDAVGFVDSHHSRIASMHLKDRRTKAHGGDNLPWGQGDTPIASVLRRMRDRHYGFPAAIELEYSVPANSNPVAEVAKCLNYCRQALQTVEG
jgi:sugar phosphate isomerase/epimerase